MEDSQLHWCAWHLLDGLGDRAVNTLVGHFQRPEDAYPASDKVLLGIGLKPTQISIWQAFRRSPYTHTCWQQAQLWLAQNSATSIISIHDNQYPLLLRQISSPPALLYVRGRLDLLNSPQIAMVGSRRASSAGLAHARDFARVLATNGLTVTSGGALGIDAAAHLGALATGASIAVIGTGIDVVYPRQNCSLFEQLQSDGAIVSEFRPGTAPLPQNFPRRNRIIAGMSFATLVVEAALRSGSLITAQQALDFNREVFAIPGAINDPRAKGTNALIKQGAKLTESVADIVEEFADRIAASRDDRVAVHDPGEQMLLASVDFAPTPLELIAERSQLPIASLLPILIELELSGHLVKEFGGYSRI